ncbi:uncharacterized protein [Haliotis asinina]|uniref:uncharacterized protein n=1 Tax=Haliotis asinina TaxID=109174 RepID=UPI0035321F8A
MKIVLWVVCLCIGGTVCWDRSRCYEDHCNEKRCQICEDMKQHCSRDYMSSQCDGFCKALELIGNKTRNPDSYMDVTTNSDERRIRKLQNILAKRRRDFETVSRSLKDAQESIKNLIYENNYLRNIISDPKEMLFYEPNGQGQHRSCDCRIQEDSLSQCLTQLKEQARRTDVVIGNVIDVCRHELVVLLSLACLIIYLMYTCKSSSSQNS